MARVTLKQVAAQSGVSYQTVSEVVKGSDKVAPETRKRVQAALETLDYHPNHAARSMRLSKSMNIAYVVYRIEDFTDPAMGENLSGMLEALDTAGYSLTIEAHRGGLERIRASLGQGKIDGAILASLPHEILPETLSSWGHPLVAFDPPPHVGGIGVVRADYRGGVVQAVQHLFERGRRNIAFIGGPPDYEMPLWHNTERHAGFEVGMGQVGLSILPEQVVHADYSVVGGRAAMCELLERGLSLDAVVCASDRMAVGAAQEIKSRGLNVPRDLAVTGFNDSEFAQTFDPPLTTVHFPIREMGLRAAEMLLERILNPDALEREHLVISLPLIVRGSS